MQNECINEYLLNKKVLNLYDLNKTKENVFSLLSEFLRLQYKYLEIKPPKITYNYEVKSECKSNDRFDSLTYYLDKKYETEKEIKAFYFELQKVLMSMTKEEIIVCNNLFLKRNSEESVCENLGLSRTGLRPIKNSCLLKIALAFNLEKLK